MRSSVLVLGACLLCGACAAGASAKVNSGGEASGDVQADTTGDTSGSSGSSGSNGSTSSPPAPQTGNATAFSSGPNAGSYGVCPFHCYVAQGASRVAMAPEDEARIGQAFAETMGQFRSCGDGRRYRRRSSPTVNLRFNAQGELAESGYDLESYVRDPDIGCYATVPRNLPTVGGPPSSTVRCAEVCERPKAPARTKGKNGRTAPAPTAAVPPAAPAATATPKAP